MYVLGWSVQRALYPTLCALDDCNKTIVLINPQFIFMINCSAVDECKELLEARVTSVCGATHRSFSLVFIWWGEVSLWPATVLLLGRGGTCLEVCVA